MPHEYVPGESGGIYAMAQLCVVIVIVGDPARPGARGGQSICGVWTVVCAGDQ